jgi:probable rRNA maturation factor
VKTPARKPALRVFSQIPRARISRQHLLKCARIALRRFRRPVSQIDFILVNARKMSLLHRQFLGLPGPTDVMAFDLSENRESAEGEVYICLDQARRQADFYGVSLAFEVARLAVHGMLHLAGEKDTTESGRKRMRLIEDEILDKAGRTR